MHTNANNEAGTMTTVTLLHNHFEQAHLNAVVEEMKIMGSPTIRCYDLGFDDLVQAIEGCHRLRACEVLGITPDIEIVDADTLISDLEGLDVDWSEDTIESLGDLDNDNINFDLN